MSLHSTPRRDYNMPLRWLWKTNSAGCGQYSWLYNHQDSVSLAPEAPTRIGIVGFLNKYNKYINESDLFSLLKVRTKHLPHPYDEEKKPLVDFNSFHSAGRHPQSRAKYVQQIRARICPHYFCFRIRSFVFSSYLSFLFGSCK